MRVSKSLFSLCLVVQTLFAASGGYAVPANEIPPEGTKEYCAWNNSRCLSKAFRSYVQCFVPNEPITAELNYCLGKALDSFRAFEYTDFGTPFQDLLDGFDYEVAECLAAFSGRPQEYLFNEQQFAMCYFNYRWSRYLCSLDYGACENEILRKKTLQFLGGAATE